MLITALEARKNVKIFNDANANESATISWVCHRIKRASIQGYNQICVTPTRKEAIKEIAEAMKPLGYKIHITEKQITISW